MRLLTGLLLALLAIPAGAQGGPAAAPGPPAEPTGVRLGFRLGAFEPINSADSYDAVFGEPMPQLGLQVEAAIRGRWLLALAVDHGEVDGERVLLTDPPQGTGVPVTLTVTPVQLTAGVLFRPAPRWRAGLGVGPTLLLWEDESAGESRSRTDTGGHVLLGLRRALGSPGGPERWSLGGELRYSSVPDAIGQGGVSEFFGEDDLGGLAVQLLALYRLR
jgi:hypothetical protein